MWAAHSGADIINLSVSLRRNTPALKKALRYCWDRNIVVITSMGNKRSPQHAALSRYPAAYPWTIAVGGVEKAEEALRIWENSATGPYVDVVAPAKDIWVEVPQYRGRTRLANNRYGNSLAASFVAGTAALMLSAMDVETKKALSRRPGGLTESIRRILHQTASNEKLGYFSPNPVSGHGMIEIPKAIALARIWSPEDLTLMLPAYGFSSGLPAGSKKPHQRDHPVQSIQDGKPDEPTVQPEPGPENGGRSPGDDQDTQTICRLQQDVEQRERSQAVEPPTRGHVSAHGSHDGTGKPAARAREPGQIEE
jgi:hypothetical protein